MKKLAVCTAFLLAGVPFARTIVPQAPNLAGDCYRITTAEELYGFAEIVNKGETNACGIQGIVQNRNFTLNTPKPGSYIVRIGHNSQMIKVH